MQRWWRRSWRRRRWRMRRRRRRRTTVIKSNNPHLAGGEKQQKYIRFNPPKKMSTIKNHKHMPSNFKILALSCHNLCSSVFAATCMAVFRSKKDHLDSCFLYEQGKAHRFEYPLIPTKMWRATMKGRSIPG